MKDSRLKLNICGVIFSLFVMSGISLADRSDVFNLNLESLNNSSLTYISGKWKYHAGNDGAWSEAGIDDSQWEVIDYQSIRRLELGSEWEGIGWFRKWINADSAIVNKNLGLRIRYIGAYELFLNGKKIAAAGIPDSERDADIAEKDFSIKLLKFSRPDSNVIAIKYSNYLKEFFDRTRSLQGPSISVAYFDELNSRNIEDRNSTTIQFTVLISIAAILAVLHTFLFLFNTKTRSNLYYVLFLLFFAVYMLVHFQLALEKDSWEMVTVLIRVIPLMLAMTVLFGSTAAYSIFSDLPEVYPYVLASAIVLGIAGFVFYGLWAPLAVYAFIFVISPPTGYKIFLRRKEDLGGEWIIRSGFLFMSAAGIYQMFYSFGWVGPIFGVYIIYFYGVLGFIISMSVLLARDFAITNKSLEVQLQNVQQLSDKTLRQELEKKELETKKKILEADNQRKTKELEDARKLQLSMLPQKLPDIDGLEIAAYMNAATEVGGDYYDFIESKDGTLNVAIGDATGHGTRAGTMVASIKSLFAALGGSMMIPDFFKRCTEIIKSMKLGNLFMSMTILRIKGNYMIASSAGMPPIMIYRAAKKTIEDIILKGMPLGAFTDYDYHEHEEELDSGDIVILMSDGSPELFNVNKEMFGENRIKSVIYDSIDKSPDDIIKALVSAGENWRGDALQEDDITFIVIKFL